MIMPIIIRFDFDKYERIMLNIDLDIFKFALCEVCF